MLWVESVENLECFARPSGTCVDAHHYRRLHCGHATWQTTQQHSDRSFKRFFERCFERCCRDHKSTAASAEHPACNMICMCCAQLRIATVLHIWSYFELFLDFFVACTVFYNLILVSCLLRPTISVARSPVVERYRKDRPGSARKAWLSQLEQACVFCEGMWRVCERFFCLNVCSIPQPTSHHAPRAHVQAQANFEGMGALRAKIHGYHGLLLPEMCACRSPHLAMLQGPQNLKQINDSIRVVKTNGFWPAWKDSLLSFRSVRICVH